MAEYFKEKPVYSVSVYGYFLPLIVAFMVLGRASYQPFRQVIFMVILIILNSFSVIIYNSVFTCMTDEQITDGNEVWLAIVYEGTKLANYLLFVWLYQWHEIYLTKKQEAELKTLVDKPVADDVSEEE
jgi:hypothetical protein